MQIITKQLPKLRWKAIATSTTDEIAGHISFVRKLDRWMDESKRKKVRIFVAESDFEEVDFDVAVVPKEMLQELDKLEAEAKAGVRLDQDGKCTKRFPKAVVEHTTQDTNGNFLYKRRSDGGSFRWVTTLSPTKRCSPQRPLMPHLQRSYQRRSCRSS